MTAVFPAFQIANDPMIWTTASSARIPICDGLPPELEMISMASRLAQVLR
jgi:hypothetical protein